MNKTKILKSLTYLNIPKDKINKEEYKNLIDIKRRLRKLTKTDIESIEYNYFKLLELYYLSCKQQIDKSLHYYIKDIVKYILQSNIKTNFYAIEEINQWYNLNIL